MKHYIIFLFLLLSSAAFACTEESEGGFFPKNDLYLPAGNKSINAITKLEFDAAIEKVKRIYDPIFQSLGHPLYVENKWDSGEVNAYASRIGNLWAITFHGGLARHASTSVDGFIFAICHEIGHHLGGFPKKASWATNEGQSDYFAVTKCLRRVFLNDDNAAILRRISVPDSVSRSCERSFGNSDDRDICIRSTLAGLSIAKVLADVTKAPTPSLQSTDSTVVSTTFNDHPKAQCRLDTIIQGALCEVGQTEDFSDTLELDGACHGYRGQEIGARPRCWFAPKYK